MRKILLSVVLIAISINITIAQGLYFGVDGGYGFSAAKSTYLNNKTTSDTIRGSTTEFHSKPYSFGKGINLGLFVGYMFNKYVGAEIGAAYVIGYKLKSYDYRWGDNNDHANYDGTMQGNMFRLVPTLKYVFGENKFHPYAKAGLIIGMGAKVVESTTETYTSPSSPSSNFVYIRTLEYKGGMSFGFHGAFGVNYMFTNRICVFAEFAVNYHNWAPKKSEVTEDTNNGVDRLPTLSTEQKQTEFVKDYYDNNYSNNGSQPSQAAKFYMPFSSIGFNIGLHISLEKKSEVSK